MNYSLNNYYLLLKCYENNYLQEVFREQYVFIKKNISNLKTAIAANKLSHLIVHP